MLASDYDATVANDGVILPDTLEALLKLKDSGWVMGLVTGRELADLLDVCKRIDIFDLIVAENGALIYLPKTRGVIELTSAPPGDFIIELSRRGIPFSAGDIIVATDAPYAPQVLSVIRDLGLELQIIFNKGSAMILPAGVNKATGLKVGVSRIGLKMSQVVGVGDAENDHAFLEACGLSVAVANALDSIKVNANIVTRLPSGQGVAELISEYLLNPACDLARIGSDRVAIE
jgi:hydroxymethylpyrimidine pyrophosphatase-like HAD family hydrolase